MASATVYGSLPFGEQIRFFQAKQPTAEYWLIRSEAHDHAFISVGARRADLVAELHELMARGIRDGLTLQAFRPLYYTVLDRHRWEPGGGRVWRSHIFFETNLRTSYAAGRYAQLQAIKGERPFWMYRHSDAVEHPRELHLAWSGLVIHADNPWWRTHYPPNGWGCQCFVSAYRADELADLGKSGPDVAPDSPTRRVAHKGEVIEVPEGIDPGWAYAPGSVTFEQRVQLTLEKTTRLPAKPAAYLIDQTLTNPRASAALQEGWVRWLRAAVTGPVQLGRRVPVGALSPTTLKAMHAAGVEARTALISLGDNDLQRIVREANAAALTELEALPRILAQPQAVLWDMAASAVLYVDAKDPHEASPWVVRVSLPATGDGQAANRVRHATRRERAELKTRLGETLLLLEGALSWPA